MVVDDGSGPQYESIFAAAARVPGVSVVKHAVNLGKGAALKTGMNMVMLSFPDACGVVTADADGQHAPADVLALRDLLERNPESLVLGGRTFAEGVPLRSRLGNELTRLVVWAVVGKRFVDTQTGLRGIPRSFMASLLPLAANRYEFELDMLIQAKQQGIKILEQPIQTIYVEGNESSHFRPFFDSMRVYFVLLRFTFASLLTAFIDNLVFLVVYRMVHSILIGQICARSCAVLFNYTLVRSSVFRSHGRIESTLPKFLLLVVLNGLLSYSLIQLLVTHTRLSVIAAKILAETLLFAVSFVIQRDLVFGSRDAEAK
jgi:putative flippase GtrA